LNEVGRKIAETDVNTIRIIKAFNFSLERIERFLNPKKNPPSNKTSRKGLPKTPVTATKTKNAKIRRRLFCDK
jgi:hypothetical protein